ncbi:SEFIR domain-containing protein [Cesiribacter sp. SM1]|uniref:SEFIR domain-containing protein n=1 Tax=Cesiribacter sp. SM1 TaxID=2861196 RepID=UPI001CD2DD64|nr:SEFIR domain-containing protein [Cesiribacter sp. SM1]
MDKKKVFVTYSWDGEEHEKKVLSFTLYLIEKGFDAKVDKIELQEQTGLNFRRMMHDIFLHSDKIIIVLSKNYKKKAENNEGGVGIEYGYILNEINENSKKFILVAFEPYSKDIIPIGFKGIDVTHLSDAKAMNKLFALLLDKKTFNIPEIGKDLPVIEQDEVPYFEDYLKPTNVTPADTTSIAPAYTPVNVNDFIIDKIEKYNHFEYKFQSKLKINLHNVDVLLKAHDSSQHADYIVKIEYLDEKLSSDVVVRASSILEQIKAYYLQTTRKSNIKTVLIVVYNENAGNKDEVERFKKWANNHVASTSSWATKKFIISANEIYNFNAENIF